MNQVSPIVAKPYEAWTGSRLVDVRRPRPRDIILSEVAIGLSRETRYGGATTAVPWSVGQHCLLADHLAEEDGVTSPEIRATLLLHDAPEYILRDLIRPVKKLCPDYQRLESVWWIATATRFGLPFEMPSIVVHYDMLACACEKAALISPDSGEWPGLPAPRPIPPRLLAATPTAIAAEFERKVLAALALLPSAGRMCDTAPTDG